jgi:hypothetical protein
LSSSTLNVLDGVDGDIDLLGEVLPQQAVAVPLLPRCHGQ